MTPDRRDQRERINAIAEYLLQVRAYSAEGRGMGKLPGEVERRLLAAERELDAADDALAKLDSASGGVGGRYKVALEAVKT
jgi:hypothetical protein